MGSLRVVARPSATCTTKDRYHSTDTCFACEAYVWDWDDDGCNSGYERLGCLREGCYNAELMAALSNIHEIRARIIATNEECSDQDPFEDLGGGGESMSDKVGKYQTGRYVSWEASQRCGPFL